MYSWYSFWTIATHCWMVPLRSRSTSCKVQNKLARVVCNVTTRSTPSISFVICFGFPSAAALRLRSTTCVTKHTDSIIKLATLVPYVSRRRLSYDEVDLLTVPRSRTKTSARRFSSVAPKVWNGLSLVIRKSNSIGTHHASQKRIYSVVTL